ncbi:hypothetical protein OQA88_10166 [Cercophora sp. LCS_1]
MAKLHGQVPVIDITSDGMQATASAPTDDVFGGFPNEPAEETRPAPNTPSSAQPNRHDSFTDHDTTFSKPPVLRKIDPGSGYQYGPAAPISAANFRMPNKTASARPFTNTAPPKPPRAQHSHAPTNNATHDIRLGDHADTVDKASWNQDDNDPPILPTRPAVPGQRHATSGQFRQTNDFGGEAWPRERNSQHVIRKPPFPEFVKAPVRPSHQHKLAEEAPPTAFTRDRPSIGNEQLQPSHGRGHDSNVLSHIDHPSSPVVERPSHPEVRHYESSHHIAHTNDVQAYGETRDFEAHGALPYHESQSAKADGGLEHIKAHPHPQQRQKAYDHPCELGEEALYPDADQSAPTSHEAQERTPGAAWEPSHSEARSPHSAYREINGLPQDGPPGRNKEATGKQNSMSIQPLRQVLPEKERQSVVQTPPRKTRAQMPSRPFRETPVETTDDGDVGTKLRPRSRHSNVSKRRSAKVHAANTSRAYNVSSESSSDSLKGTPPLPRPFGGHAFVADIAGVVNKHQHAANSERSQEAERYVEYIRKLKRQRERNLDDIQKYSTYVDDQKEKIEKLRKSEQALAEQVKAMSVEAQESAEKVRKMEEKYHICKGHLNAAIEEQQRLYARMKKKCDDTIREVRVVEQSQKALVDISTQKGDAAMKEIRQSVRDVVTESQAEIKNLTKKVEAAERQVEQKNVELVQERERLQVLSDKLRDAQESTAGFQELMSQNKTVLDKLEERIAAETQHGQLLESQAREGFQAVQSCLSIVSEIMARGPKTMSELQRVCQESVAGIATKLNALAESQNSSRESNDQFWTNLENQVRMILGQINSRFNEVVQQLDEKKKENNLHEELFSKQEQQRRGLETELEVLRRESERHELQMAESEEKIAILQAARGEHEVAKRQLGALQREVDRLAEENNISTNKISDLESKLRAKDESYLSEMHQFSANVVKLNQVLQEKESASRKAAQEAAEMARREAKIELGQAISEARLATEDVKRQRDSLMTELEISTRISQEKEEIVRQQNLAISSLKERMAILESEHANLAENSEQQIITHQQFQIQEAEKTKRLEEGLASSRGLTSKAQEEGKREHSKLMSFISVVDGWATREHLSTEAVGHLRSMGSEAATVEEFKTRASRTFDQLMADFRASWVPEPSAVPEITVRGDEGSRFFPRHENQSFQTPADIEGVPVAQMMDTTALQVPFESTQEQTRRVMVRSPASKQPEPSPPTIDEEKTARRIAVQPKSIIKPTSATPKTGTEDGSVEGNVVAGDTSAETPQTAEPKRQGPHARTAKVTETAAATRERRKRPRETETPESEPSRRAKRPTAKAPAETTEPNVSHGRQRHPPASTNPESSKGNSKVSHNQGPSHMTWDLGAQLLSRKSSKPRTYGSQQPDSAPQTSKPREWDSQELLKPLESQEQTVFPQADQSLVDGVVFLSGLRGKQLRK